jgi:hypothetical protein
MVFVLSMGDGKAHAADDGNRKTNHHGDRVVGFGP